MIKTNHADHYITPRPIFTDPFDLEYSEAELDQIEDEANRPGPDSFGVEPQIWWPIT